MMSRTWRNSLLLPVGLALCVSLSRAQTGSATRIEETDSSVSFSGNWYRNGSSANSGGGAALTNAMGARAAISFTGTGTTWLGVADPWAGVARVYLDGTLNTVDTYGPGTQYQRALFTARGLAPGPHTLSIEVIHMRDVNGNGSWIWVDGFEIENGTGVRGGVTAATGRIEQPCDDLHRHVVFEHQPGAERRHGGACGRRRLPRDRQLQRRQHYLDSVSR